MNEKSDFLRAGAFPTLLANSGGPLDDNSIRTVSNFIREGHCTRFGGEMHRTYSFVSLHLLVVTTPRKLTNMRHALGTMLYALLHARF